ncbi:MAG TPA: hypothetical protein VMU75_04555 [Acidimicrobiales bacterium]|nr:hypothetical protein [Acidimicrobiales bacterium]
MTRSAGCDGCPLEALREALALRRRLDELIEEMISDAETERGVVRRLVVVASERDNAPRK